METDVAMPDDPLEKDEGSKDAEKDAEPMKDHKELPEQLPDRQYINQGGQDEASVEEAGTDTSQTARKASKKSPCKMQQGAVFSGNILSFGCSECKGDTTYSPNDLLKHFQGSHKGTLPTYPCDLCSFVTNEFSSLQRHRIGHRNPQVTCEICNDGVQYSLLLLTRHYIMCHSQNGQFHCEKCEFSTRDAGTFVQHIHSHNEGRHKCVKCQYDSPSRRELQRHVLVHSATFPFTCHFCGYGAARKDYLTKHMATAHCEENDRKRWRMIEEKPCVTSPPGLKLLLKKGPVAGGSREPQWMSKLHTLPGVGLLDQNGRLYNPEKTLEETQQFLERAVRVKKENSMWMKSAVKTEPQCSYPSSPATPQPKPPETDSSPGSGLLNPNNSNGLTVLMVKNKISIPPNCTTKVMGFKMVDGKKHLVLKVIPTKQEPSSHCEGSTAEKELDSQSTDDTANEPKYPDSSDDGEKSYNSPCSVVSSPLGSLHRPDSLESSTAGTTNDLAKTMKGVDLDNDIDEELPMEVECIGGAEQSRKCIKENYTAQHENCLEDIPFLPLSQYESTISSPTKESKTTVHQSNGGIHSENSSSDSDPSKSTIESSHLDRPPDSNENKPPIAHSTLSKATVLGSLTGSNAPSESLGNTVATSHSFSNTTTLSESVMDTLLDAAEDMTMPSHSAENDISPSDSPKASKMDSESTQSDSVYSKDTSVDATVDSIAYSGSTDNEPTPPNSEIIPSDLTEHEERPSDSAEGKATLSDSAEVKDKIADSIEDVVTPPDSVEGWVTPPYSFEVKATLSDSVHKATFSDSIDRSILSESTEETDRLDSIERKSRPSETIDDDSIPSHLIEDNAPPSDSAEDRGAPSNSVESPSLDSVEDKVMPSESGEDKDATEDSIENMEILLNSDENKGRTSDSIDDKDTPFSSDEDIRILLVSTEGKDINSNSVCKIHSPESYEKAMSSESSEDNIKHSDITDVASPTDLSEKARTSHSATTTGSAMSETVPVVVEETIHANSNVNETRIAEPSAEKAMTLQSTLDGLAPTDVSAAEIKPSSGTEEPDAPSTSAKDEIVLNEAINANPVLDTVPLSVVSTDSKTIPSKPPSDTILPPDGIVEKATPQLLSTTSNTDRSDSEISNPLSVHKDSIDADTSRNSKENSPSGSEKPTDTGNSETPLSHVTDSKAQFPENNHTASIECFSEVQNSITSQENHSGITRNDSKPNASLRNESGLHAVSETDPVVADADSAVLNSTMNSPNQEVFSFHNYSKEKSGSLPDSLLSGDQGGGQTHEVDEEECSDLRISADWSLTLDASPPAQTGHCGEEEADGSKTLSSDEGDLCSTAPLERVSDSDIEVDECIAAVDDLSHSVEKQSSVQSTPSVSSKMKEDATSPHVGQKGPGIKHDVAVFGRILEKHSEAIINHQLEKERMGSSTGTYDSVRPTKTTLKILQTPEGKQQMFLQTPDNQYAVPVQLKSAPGFKLITKSSASKINVSYMQPGIERPSKTTGLALTLSGGRLGVGGKTSSRGDKGATHLSSVQLGTNSSGGHYLVNSASLKSPILLSGTVKSPTGDQTTNRAPTCYLLQRPLPVSPVSGSSSLDPSGSSSQAQQSSRPDLAMLVNASDKTSPLQAGRQAYLVRYISPAKSGILLNNAEGKTASSNMQSNESGRSRVFLKIVRSPNGTRFLTNVPGSLGKKPIYLATGALQSPCFLMSSNRSIVNVSGLKASNLQHGSSRQPAMASQLSDTLPQVRLREDGMITHKKSHHILNQTRMSQRKRQRKALFDDLLETPSKARRLSSRPEPTEWAPVPKDVERTLRLSPFSAFQKIKCPRQNQPVVVLNHPDADIPEVVNIMKSVNRFKGDVLKVALSQRTVQALSELSLSGIQRPRPNMSKSSMPHSSARARLFGSTVRERFILKLKLKKMSRNRYEVVKSSSCGSAEQPSTFSCWFCGRMFNNQEDWIGHGQRHLMEATRDWNKLF
ncbi:zinc finger protein 518A [Clupea harengus]|uniref:Zinc finger protein 518A n=1 Tax=Clupea harengus TaxID=7950 RepID=A0A6P3VFC0_CLUHA|nr:zinc finger protein 518A [Clupea harengus]